MAYSIQKYDDIPAVLYAFDATFSMKDHAETATAEIMAALDALDTPHYLIMELTYLKIGLEDLMVGVRMATQQANILKHANVIQTITVTTNPMLSFSTKGMNTPIFGNIEIELVKTLDAALDYVRSKLAE